tara:strand:+ start:357 stop:545 length:189 start_codon:yes stop_codon:yes gene_type:complete
MTMDLLNATSIQYVKDNDGVKYAINIRNAGLLTTVPMIEDNTDYQKILQLVADKTITIEEAD